MAQKAAPDKPGGRNILSFAELFDGTKLLSEMGQGLIEQIEALSDDEFVKRFPDSERYKEALEKKAASGKPPLEWKRNFLKTCGLGEWEAAKQRHQKIAALLKLLRLAEPSRLNLQQDFLFACLKNLSASKLKKHNNKEDSPAKGDANRDNRHNRAGDFRQGWH